MSFCRRVRPHDSGSGKSVRSIVPAVAGSVASDFNSASPLVQRNSSSTRSLLQLFFPHYSISSADSRNRVVLMRVCPPTQIRLELGCHCSSTPLYGTLFLEVP